MFLKSEALQPELVNAIKSVKIDEVKTHKDGFDIHLYDMRVEDFSCNEDPCIKATFDDGGKLHLKVDDAKIKFHIRASASKSIFHVATVCDAKLGPGKIKVDATVQVQLSSLFCPNLNC